MALIMANKENQTFSIPDYIEEARRISTGHRATVTVTPCPASNTNAHMSVRRSGGGTCQEFNVTFLCQPETFMLNLGIVEARLKNFVEKCEKSA